MSPGSPVLHKGCRCLTPPHGSPRRPRCDLAARRAVRRRAVRGGPAGRYGVAMRPGAATQAARCGAHAPTRMRCFSAPWAARRRTPLNGSGWTGSRTDPGKCWTNVGCVGRTTRRKVNFAAGRRFRGDVERSSVLAWGDAADRSGRAAPRRFGVGTPMGTTGESTSLGGASRRGRGDDDERCGGNG